MQNGTRTLRVRCRGRQSRRCVKLSAEWKTTLRTLCSRCPFKHSGERCVLVSHAMMVRCERQRCSASVLYTRLYIVLLFDAVATKFSIADNSDRDSSEASGCCVRISVLQILRRANVYLQFNARSTAITRCNDDLVPSDDLLKAGAAARG